MKSIHQRIKKKRFMNKKVHQIVYLQCLCELSIRVSIGIQQALLNHPSHFDHKRNECDILELILLNSLEL